MYKVLVIGGSYFMGRVFNILASRTGKYDIRVINRGRYTLNLENVVEMHFDRHNTAMIRGIVPDDNYDAIIDFCAYEPGDIYNFVGSMLNKPSQYIYISTASVYDPYAPAPVNENSPVATRFGTDENSVYVEKKLKLEEELKYTCEHTVWRNMRNMAYTILRPTFVYGPFNYAPREPMYFQNIIKGNPIPHPTDAAAKFQFVYVKDIARMIMAAIGNEKAYNQIFNLAAPDELDYNSFLAELEKANGGKVDIIPMTCAEIAQQQVPLPFPMQYDELYDGSKIVDTLGVGYTPFTDAFKETFDIYMKAMRG